MREPPKGGGDGEARRQHMPVSPLQRGQLTRDTTIRNTRAGSQKLGR